jgi:hypothetical protein
MTRKILSPVNDVALIPFTMSILIVLQHVEKNTSLRAIFTRFGLLDSIIDHTRRIPGSLQRESL